MSHDIPLIIALVTPLVALTFLGVNASLVFLSLCLGQVLVKYVASSALAGLSVFSAHTSNVTASALQLGFLFGPAIVTTVLMIGSVHGKLRRILNAVPALGVGLLGTLVAVPLFTPGLRQAIEGGPFWHQLDRGQALVVGITALISLLFLWSQRRSFTTAETRSGRHHG